MVEEKECKDRMSRSDLWNKASEGEQSKQSVIIELLMDIRELLDKQINGS